MNPVLRMYVSLRESLGIHTREQLLELLGSWHHTESMARHRAAVIQSRVYFFSVVFAILVPAWSIIDYLFLPPLLWAELLGLRLLAGIIFAIVAWRSRLEPDLTRAKVLLVVLLAVTPLFHLIADHWLDAQPLSGSEQLVAQLYGLLPFVMLAGLTLFPLTLAEFAAFAVSMLGVVIYSAFPEAPEDIATSVATVWLSVLILGIAMFSSLTQLRYMLSQVTYVSYDTLTGTLTRRAGIEILELQHRIASMHGNALSVLYFDLDHFKAINDNFGHPAGDQVLTAATARLTQAVRKGDSVIRWGGEEFIVVLPGAGPHEANEVVARVMASGLGRRPDGQEVTASIGVAELTHDRPRDWKAQIEIADQRMYAAKSSGRARSIGVDGNPLCWPAEA